MDWFPVLGGLGGGFIFHGPGHGSVGCYGGLGRRCHGWRGVACEVLCWEIERGIRMGVGDGLEGCGLLCEGFERWIGLDWIMDTADGDIDIEMFCRGNLGGVGSRNGKGSVFS